MIKRMTARKNWLRILVGVLVFLGAGTSLSRPSQALLLIDEMVYIGPKAGAASFKIKNTSNEPQAYRMEWTELKMNPDGKKQDIRPGEAVPGVMAASPYMFLSPRRLIVMPDQLQNLRLMVRRTADMPAGEYRSYMVFQPEALPSGFNAGPDSQQGAQKKSAVSVSMLAGFRIPVFFLNGETTLRNSVVNAGFGEKGGQRGFYFTFIREGNRSAIGELEIRCTAGNTIHKLATTRIQIFTEVGSLDYFLNSSDIPQECTTATIEYKPHPNDPDFTGDFVKMGEIPLR